MKVVVAPDKFKGTATAAEVAGAVADVLVGAGHEVVQLPMADGGDGTVAALGGANRTTTVTGPLGDPVEAAWRLDRDLAVIEMAEASGLVLAGGPEGNDPLNATTRGTGELIMTAVARGARRIIVGLGGSATTDGGLGAVEAVGSSGRLKGLQVEVATDVTTRFVDAAEVFGPQKGATDAQVRFLTARLQGLATRYLDEFGVDVTELEGAGAAGGLGGGLAALGASIVSGFDLIADEVGLASVIETADLVVTGEGGLDAESFNGKVVGGVIEIATEFGVPTVAVVGAADDEGLAGAAAVGATVLSLTDAAGSDRALAAPVDVIRNELASRLLEI